MSVPYPYNILKLEFEDETHWWFKCIFHKGDNTPSLSIDKPNGKFPSYYKCWACGAKGSAVKFARLTKQSEYPIQETLPKQEIKRPKIDWNKRLVYQVRISTLARKIGVSVDTINKFNVCYDPDINQWLIPMYDETGICGIQTRDIEGNKRCLKWSRHGWFIPQPLIKFPSYYSDAPLYICEGWSDAAILKELGFVAISRFNALHIKKPPTIYENFEKIIIVSDTDEIGIKGAKKLQKLIPNSKVLIPMGYPDIRALYLDRGKDFTKCFLKGEIYL